MCEPNVDYVPWQDDVPEIEVVEISVIRLQGAGVSLCGIPRAYLLLILLTGEVLLDMVSFRQGNSDIWKPMNCFGSKYSIVENPLS